jgi:hypothetical protein
MGYRRKTNLELRVPKSKGAYYATQVIEYMVIAGVAILAYYRYHTIVLPIIILLLGLYFPLSRMLRPKYLVMNDEGIFIHGYPNPKESIVIKWKEVTNIYLEHNNVIGAIRICFRDLKRESLRLRLDEFNDISDELFTLYFARHNKRIKNLLEALCKANSVYFETI